jgi:glycosyltransferase involved in cell wall biosynthesis
MKKSVVFVHPHCTLAGGSTTVVIERSKRMVNLGWAVTVVSLKTDPTIVHEAAVKGVKFLDIDGPLSSSLRFWFFFPYYFYKISRLIESVEANIVISGAFPASWWGWFYKITHPKTTHIYYCLEPSAFIYYPDWIKSIKPSYMRWALWIIAPLFRTIEQTLIQYTDKFVAISNFTKNELLTFFPHLKPEQIKMIYCGIDHDNFYPTVSIERKKQVVILGVLAKFKKIDLVIKAFGELYKHSGNHDIQLIIKGRGSEAQMLRKLARELGVANQIQFIERFMTTDELRHLLSESMINVHAADREPFGLAPIEAMACGTPAIVTGMGGTGETIVDKDSGLYFKVGDFVDLAEKLSLLFRDHDLWQSISIKAVQKARTFDWDHTTKEFCSFLLEPNPPISKV